MKKVCCLFTSEYPFSSGEPFLESEVDFLSKSFKEVFVFSFYNNRKSKQTRRVPENFQVFKLNINPKKKIKYIIKGIFSKGRDFSPNKSIKYNLYSLLLNGRINAAFKRIMPLLNMIDKESYIYIYSYWSNYICTLSIKVGDYLKSNNYIVKKTVSRAHGCDIYSERKKMESLPFQNFNFKKVDYVFPCSIDGERELSQRYPNYKNKIHHKYLGVSAKNINSSSLQSKTFLTVSYFIPVKRMELFADAFIIFLKKNPGWRWIAVGGGSKKRIDFIHSKFRETGLQESFIYLGEISNSDLMQMYENNKFSYLVNTSISEGIPVSIMEAESFGVPCIAPLVGGICEIINHENGILFEQTNSKLDICKALEKASNIDCDEYCLMSQNCISYSSDNFNCNNNYKSFVEELAE